MPRLPRLRVPVLEDLARQVRFEPAKAARRQLALAEALAPEIEPDRTYPEDWVIFRLTGFRTEGEAPTKRSRRAAPAPAPSPTLIVGAALLADLPSYVERLCVAAKLTPHDLDIRKGVPAPAERAWLDAAALCARWKISRKTLDRYRRTGLLARRIVGDDARHRLMFALAAVESFESRNREKLAGAAGFSRIDSTTESRIIRRAERYHRALGCSLNEAAERLAQRFGRSHEAVRQLLQRHDRAAREPIFAQPMPLGKRQRRLVERALARGIEAGLLARRLQSTPASIYYAHLLRRAERIRELDLEGPGTPAFEKPGAAEKYLAPASVRTALGRAAHPSLAVLLDELSDEAADPKAETAQAAAYWYLRAQSAALIASLPRRSPSAAALDQIETRLRWAARLKAELVRSQLALAIKSIEAALGRPVTELPSPVAGRVVTLAIDALIEAIDRFDPFKGGRPAAPAGLAVSRSISAWLKGEGSRWAPPPPSGPRDRRPSADHTTTASPRADAHAVRLSDWTRRVCPWQAWLEPSALVRPAIDQIAPRERDILIARHGWNGDPPQTLDALAKARAVTSSQIVRLERSAARHAIAAARRSATPPLP